MFTFLFVDVDGYCSGGIDQATIVSEQADGYRARELGWSYYTEDASETGSVYFYDRGYAPLDESESSIWHVRRLHGLPICPAPEYFRNEAVTSSSRLLDAFRVVHDAVASATARTVVIVHKGGNEGEWARRAIPGVRTIDLGGCGCPKVDTIGTSRPALRCVRPCAFHDLSRARARKVVHCPRLEVFLLSLWVAHGVAEGDA